MKKSFTIKDVWYTRWTNWRQQINSSPAENITKFPDMTDLNEIKKFFNANIEHGEYFIAIG